MLNKKAEAVFNQHLMVKQMHSTAHGKIIESI